MAEGDVKPIPKKGSSIPTPVKNNWFNYVTYPGHVWGCVPPFVLDIYRKYGGFLKWGYPAEIVYVNRILHYKASILGTPISR